MKLDFTARAAKAQIRTLLLPLAIFGLTACAPTSDKLGDNKASRASAAGQSTAGPAARNPYSARVVTDPYVLQQQRSTAEALRRSCEQRSEHCDLAAAATRYMDEQDARR
jgi:hypothetical protein